MLHQKNLSDKIIGRISVNGNGSDFIARLESLEQSIQLLNAKEIIFCAGTLSYKNIIDQVQHVKNARIRFYAGSSIVGSDESSTNGKAISTEEEFNLAQSGSRRMKRLIDVCFALLCLLFFPIHFFFVKKPISFLKNCCVTLFGITTWVGYIFPSKELPQLRKGILAPNGLSLSLRQTLPKENLKKLDYWYARNYEVFQDIGIILKSYKYLGG
jgi:hypothetical protein